jgi:hypothetical protein
MIIVSRDAYMLRAYAKVILAAPFGKLWTELRHAQDVCKSRIAYVLMLTVQLAKMRSFRLH